MRITVLGTGAIGATLAARWLRAGHDVVLARGHQALALVQGHGRRLALRVVQ